MNLLIALVMTVQVGSWDTFYYDFEVPPEVELLDSDYVLIMINGKMPICSHLPIPKDECTYIVTSSSPVSNDTVSGIWNNITVDASLFPGEGTYIFTARNTRTKEEWEILRIIQEGAAVPQLMKPKPPILLMRLLLWDKQ